MALDLSLDELSRQGPPPPVWQPPPQPQQSQASAGLDPTLDDLAGQQYAGIWDKLFPREKPTREYPGPTLQSPEGSFNIPLITGRGQGGVMPAGAPIEQMGVMRGQGKMPKGRNLSDAQLKQWLNVESGDLQSLQNSLNFFQQNSGGLSTSRSGQIATLSDKDVGKAIDLINARIQSMQLEQGMAPLVKQLAKQRQFEREGGQVSIGGSPIEKRYGTERFKVPDFGPGTEGEIKALKGWLDATKKDRDIFQKDETLNQVYRAIQRQLKRLEND
jgi:hypothetical protein